MKSSIFIDPDDLLTSGSSLRKGIMISGSIPPVVRSQELGGNVLQGRQVNPVLQVWKDRFKGRIAGTVDTSMNSNGKEATASTL